MMLEGERMVAMDASVSHTSVILYPVGIGPSILVNISSPRGSVY